MNSTLQIQAIELASKIRKTTSKSMASIVGPNGFGKSSLLSSTANELRLLGFVPVLINPPREELDTGSAAIVQLTTGLKNAGLINGEAVKITDPKMPWSDKLQITNQWIDSNKDQVVLLCDEPDRWPFFNAAEAMHSSYSDAHTKQLVEWLNDTCPCRRVITRTKMAGRRDSVTPQFLTSENLSDGLLQFITCTDSDKLSVIADGMLSNRSSADIKFGALYVQLLVAFSYLTNRNTALGVMQYDTSVGTMAARIVETLNKPEFRPLLEVLQTISLCRGMITNHMLKQIVGNSLDGESWDILVWCLLSRVGDCYDMPDPLRRLLLKRAESDHENPSLHGNLRTIYQNAAKTVGVDGRSPLVEEYEAWFHGAAIGDESLLDSAFFVDQLHVLGRTLSRDQKKYAVAANVFKRCIDLDETDDYGHHYHAYNLDCLAKNTAAIESGYKKAIEINDSHPWWWSRWINYLITTGSAKDAKVAWDEASTNLGTASGSADDWVYGALHVWVARLSLHRAQLDFVERVLQDVPLRLQQTDARFIAIRHHLDAMRIARDGHSVFPIQVHPDSYWTKPHLDLPLTTQEGKRMSWFPARIDFVDDEFVGLVVGKHDLSSGETTYGAVELTRTLFDDASFDEKASQLAEGHFIEMGFYGSGETMKIRVHENGPYIDPYLPDFDPPNPRRYLEQPY